MACSARSTPIAAATTSRPRPPAARSTPTIRPRSAGRSPSSASTILPPIRRSFDRLRMRARGRSERMFSTLQDRLPKELQLAGIATLDAANRFIAESYLADHNARFAREPAEPTSAFVPDAAGTWREALCVQEDRVVGNDNTVRYHRLVLQLPASPLRPHFVKAKVCVHHYPDDTLAVFHGPRCLARFTSDGVLFDHAQARAA